MAPAAFGRLCVETYRQHGGGRNRNQPPSGGCVLKPSGTRIPANGSGQPPSGGCVLKQSVWVVFEGSVVPAAFGRLCVETDISVGQPVTKGASRLRAAVC